jgi:hypothetical protein
MSAERSLSLTDVQLEAALRDLGTVLAEPAGTAFVAGTPDLAARVSARIGAQGPARAGAPWWRRLPPGWLPGLAAGRPVRRSLLLATAALLVAAAVVSAAIGFGLPGIRILFGDPGSPSPAASNVPSSAVPGALLGLGTPLDLDEARDLLDFEVLLPPAPIGPPDAVYLAGSLVTLVWGPGDALPGTAHPGIGLVLVELRATVDEDYIDKLVFTGTVVERIDVDGAPGYWISGARHEIGYVDPDGRQIEDSVRTAGNTLLWTAEGITYRLEAEVDKDEALELARSLR